MQDDGWRLNVKLKSWQALHEFAKLHNLTKEDGSISGYALAKKAGLKGPTVGHITSRRRDTCSLKTARAIEEALGCPPGMLFEAQLSQVTDDSRSVERAA